MLSTHWMNESEPFERNCASSSNSRTSSERFAAASRMRSVLPTSPGRTTCRSSMKKTDTRVASRMSSIWALPVRVVAGVKRLVLIVRMRCASSRMTTSSGSLTVAVSRKYLNNAPARPPTILRRFSVNAFEPVTWSVRSPRPDSSATRLTAMTDFPVPGPPSTMKTTRAGSGRRRGPSMIAL